MAKLLWGLAYGPHATAYLDRMHPCKEKAQIVKKAKTLLNGPFQPGCIKLGTIHGVDDVWRIRSGDYRILYVVREHEVLVVDIDNRKDVYKK